MNRQIIFYVEGYIRYDKVTGGALAVLELGLDAIRRECSKFDGWLKRLETLAGN